MTTLRVVYGTEVDVTVDGSTDPKAIMATLSETYKELADATYTVSNGVMTITLKEGRKA